MRKPLIAANWKLNIVSDERGTGQAYIEAILACCREGLDIVIFPPATHIGLLHHISRRIVNSKIAFGAQDISIFDSGAHTGDISAQCVLDMGAKYVLLGHSERRKTYGETDAIVCEKTQLAIAKGLKAIVCIGETDMENTTGRTKDILTQQLDISVPKQCLADSLLIAYEPIWAIGTGRIPEPEHIATIHACVRTYLRDTRGRDFSESVHILYGGSVNGQNAKEILSLNEVDGLLVGSASLTIDTFVHILKAIQTKDNGVLPSVV